MTTTSTSNIHIEGCERDEFTLIVARYARRQVQEIQDAVCAAVVALFPLFAAAACTRVNAVP